MTAATPAVMVPRYRHRTGEHCASTALRNVLGHHGIELSEPMVFGLASGLGFLYLDFAGASPSRLFHGRSRTLENDFGLNTGVPLRDRIEPDDDAAWRILRDYLERGVPVMVSTDTFHLGYHHTSSHFPGHRCVVVGYDDASRVVFIADRKFEDLQRCSFDELRRARNAPDYPMTSQNQFGDYEGPVVLGRPLDEAIPLALCRNARAMLAPDDDLPSGVPAMRDLARGLASWQHAPDWSWAARFGYQVIVKRGAGGSFFRSLEADFLREAAARLPGLGRDLKSERLDEIAAGWRDVGELLRLQSERDDCDPALFERAGEQVGRLADDEERFFEDVLRALDRP